MKIYSLYSVPVICARTRNDLDCRLAARRAHSSISYSLLPWFLSTAWYTGEAMSTWGSLTGRLLQCRKRGVEDLLQVIHLSILCGSIAGKKGEWIYFDNINIICKVCTFPLWQISRAQASLAFRKHGRINLLFWNYFVSIIFFIHLFKEYNWLKPDVYSFSAKVVLSCGLIVYPGHGNLVWIQSPSTWRFTS